MTALTHEFSQKVAVTPARMFQALTDPADLKAWFAEHVDVDAREGGHFRFWGRHTHGSPKRADANQRLTGFTPGEGLSFTWRLEGKPSEVTWKVEADGEEGAVLKVTHHFDDLPEIGRAKDMVDDLWRLHGSNLYSWLGDRRGLLLPDYDDTSPRIVQTLFIAAPPATVFRALTEPELINKWGAKAAACEPRLGGAYSFGWTYDDGESMGPTRILAFEQDRLLEADWPDWRRDKDVPDTSIRFELEAVEGGTMLTFTHGVFPRWVDLSDYPAGWMYFLPELQKVAEAL